jgi:multicomponent Na+:H+ antiporter subunit B
LLHEEERASVIEGLALLTFILLAALGFFLGLKTFFCNYLPKGKVGDLLSAGVIPLYNIMVGMEVGAALVTIFLALVIYKEEVSK